MLVKNARNAIRVWAAVVSLIVTAEASATTWTVNVLGFTFSPANLTVAPGDTIHWVWGSGIHTVTSGTGCVYDNTYFDHPIDSAHPTFDYIIPNGVPVIHYFCRFHCLSGMVGTITVQSNNLMQLQMTVDGNQEVPAVTTSATGSGTATLDLGTNLLSWNIVFSGLSSAETGAHFHGPALACSTASPVITLPLGSPIAGSAALTAAQAADVMAGRWYVNVQTSANPTGEIRGQVMPIPLANPIPVGIPAGSIAVNLQPVASGLTAPDWGTAPPGDTSRLFVTDQTGIIWVIDLGTGSKSVFFDLSARLVSLGVFGPGTFDERGLLGLAFHPAYQSNGLLYTFSSEPVSGPADFSTIPSGYTADCQSVIAEWRVPTPGDPSSVPDVNSRRELLRVDKPQFNHNGGGLEFGPDGLLYISFGDGGGADDRDGQPFIGGVPIIGHGCGGNAQNTNAILGKIVRIDPSGTNSGNGQYGIPADNPFVGGGGLGEIFAYGLRNPWRFSFDSLSAQLYCADVGQNSVEEVDLISSGGNYAWPRKEGTFYFVFNGDQPGYVTDHALDVPPNLIEPIAEYDHDEGTAVIGGFVYRGTSLPPLVGRYVFGDWSRGFQTSDGRLFYLDEMNMINEFQLIGRTNLGLSLHGFGRDGRGELYLLANDTGAPSGTTGVVLRIALLGDMNCDGQVDELDIPAFISALIDPAGYEGTYAACDIRNADLNGDGRVDGLDVAAFTARLLGP